MRKAKIVATIGPASQSPEMIEKLIRSGANVIRLNMSHGTHEQHSRNIEEIRNVCYRIKTEVGILVDLQGPKIRVGKLDSPLKLAAGEEWYIGEYTELEEAGLGSSNFIPTTYKALASDCREGNTLLFDDGNLRATALGRVGGLLKIKVEVGGLLKSNKGINLPGVNVSAPSLTEKDEIDLEFALKNEVEFVALSFVRHAEDIIDLRNRIKASGKYLHTIAKIEKPEAIENIESIIEAVDVIMIARGDMGVELGNHLVPSLQKKIIGLCNAVGTPVITATQMLESMILAPVPTRAEASDVANAVWDGTDALMLSGETAAGDYPIEAVTMMDKIIVEAERTPKERPLLRNVVFSSLTSANQVAASLIAEKIMAKVIISISEEGRSCYKMSRFRTSIRVLGISSSVSTLRRMCLYWGITPYFHHNILDVFSLEGEIVTRLKHDGELSDGDRIVITHGNGKYFKKGTQNSLRVETVGSDRE